MANHLFLFCLVTFATLGFASAIQYVITNLAPKTPGGSRFDREIGIPLSKQLMGSVNTFIWYNIFQQQTPADRKYNDYVYLNVKDFTGVAGLAQANVIDISTQFFQIVPAKDLKWEFTALLYHEMTHVFQWTGGNTAPTGLMEGIADYVKLKAKYINPIDFPKPGQGDRWDQGYGITARFLEYCESLRGDFVAQLNKKMRNAYNEHYFVDLLGKPVGQLWNEYKAKHRI